MLEKNSLTLEELDQSLEELEQLVQQERKQNEMINHRILEKELYLEKMEIEQYQEYCN